MSSRPGAPYQAWRDSARAVVARGVARLGLTEGVDATFDPPWADQCRVVALRCTQAFLDNIGIRIEDDYAITPTGLEWLSRAPREPAETESAMSRRGH